MTLLPSQLFLFLCLACADAKRTVTGSQQGIETEEQNQLGLSCETSHKRFRLRIQTLQNFANSHKGSDDMSLVARGRAVMKTAAILRTLRRSSDCPWVTTGNIEDIETIEQVVRKILADNPCAPAALAELRVRKHDEGNEPLARAMAILMSDSCEIESQLKQSEANNIVGDIDDVEIEELVHDRAEEMLESEDTTSSLMEQSDTHRAFSWAIVGKLVGALLLGVLFALSCSFGGLLVGAFVGAMFGFLWVTIRQKMGHQFLYSADSIVGFGEILMGGLAGAGIGAVGSAGSCGYSFAMSTAAGLQ